MMPTSYCQVMKTKKGKCIQQREVFKSNRYTKYTDTHNTIPSNYL